MTLNRYYCFFDQEEQSYQLIICRQFPEQKVQTVMPLDLPFRDVAGAYQFLKQALEKELDRLKKEVFFQKFWELANFKTKNSLLLSIYLRQKYPRGVFNVEIEDWLSAGPFAQVYQEKKKLLQNWQPRQILARFIATSGNHLKSLRIGHIHLAYDQVAGRDIFSIHFDKYNPNHLKKFGLFKHFLLEDGENSNLLKVFNND
ncbi:MAG: hypothetical protein GX559_03195 [Candidatus Pacebacteria bacterium]|nr:hypothetical protein [Candidatus Paceibacterota bacterium]